MSDKPSTWYLAPIFLGIILVMSASLAINHPSFGYGGGGGGGGGGGSGGGWGTMDPRVCGDKLCSEIPGGREAYESGTVPAEEKSDPLPQEKSKIDYLAPPLKQIKDGVPSDEVICKETLQIIIKNDGSSACVRMETAKKLEERGWGVMPPPCCKDTDGIHSFEECIAAGNPAMESYPRQCRTADGKHFVEIIPGKEQCEIAGGLWGIWGNQVPVITSCNPSTSDGGKECSDSSQCQSFCQAKEGAQIGIEDTGMCYGYELAICLQEVRNGVVDPEWCQ